MTNLTSNASEPIFELRPGMHFHLVGIGGAGLSAIAWVLLGRGYVVSGSDMQHNPLTADLTAAGATVFQGHAAAHVAGADALIISSAVPAGNPEVAAARAAGVPVLKRADFLGHLMVEDIGIAVAGTHGKTTTTGMVAQILLDGELDPTVIVGGVLPALGSNGRYGSGGYFVIEADEYDHMFLGLRPEVAVITNVEHDHPDIYPTRRSYLEAFRRFARLLPENGRLVACVDDPGVRELLPALRLPGVDVTTYSAAENGARSARPAEFQALDVRPNALGGMDFVVEQEGQLIGLARLRVPGVHNVRNALAAIIVGLDCGVDFSQMQRTLAGFGGVARRFQVLGEVGGVTVIDDYAHHPTEIRVNLKAARQRYPGRRLWAVWQPHTYSRMRLLQDEFAASFGEADRVVALDIYRSRETETLGMDTAAVVRAMRHPHAVHIPGRETAAAYILDRVRPGDVVLTLGAGDGDAVGRWVLDGLRRRVQP
ncbi:MAG: UDP-N-acetylmuramate--L-alanine ligase [Anaerolineales bacterium]|nr:UDP-N-acetylmuramate--L-alanine ligase [Anaerolineales bacterium]